MVFLQKGKTEQFYVKHNLYHNILTDMNQSMTSIAKNDPWFEAFCRAVVDRHKFDLRPQIFPAATDSRFFRALGIPALGFSPMPNTPVLLHDHNEFLNEKIFICGIDVYYDIIKELASV